jgi:anti-anti-sigma factor
MKTTGRAMMTSESFSVRSERAGRVHRVKAIGELDMATVAVLEPEFDAIGDHDAVVVADLTELDFIDSSGLHLLLRLNDRFPDRFRINGSAVVERLLDIAGVRPLLPIISPTDDPLAPRTSPSA